MKVLVLDNYDSFTYNLVQYIQEILNQKVDVIRNDAISVEEVDNYDVIIFSPGPGLPKDAGIMPAVIQEYGSKKCILGVCLGHQAIGEAFGGALDNLEEVFHGVDTDVKVTDNTEILFKDVPATFKAGRYHSWVVANQDLPDCLHITAVDDEGTIMAFRHKSYEIRGVQFHPESIMTNHGRLMLQNFLEHCEALVAMESSVAKQ